VSPLAILWQLFEPALVQISLFPRILSGEGWLAGCGSETVSVWERLQ